ncbi:twin-arginine translocation signal domain-containing protein, partial [Achromobacter xylosoxidans]
MKLSRRRFLGGVAASLGSMVVPPLLRNGRVLRAATLGDEDAGPGRWRFSGAHWGAFRARVVAGRVVEIKPFEFDKHPT